MAVCRTSLAPCTHADIDRRTAPRRSDDSYAIAYATLAHLVSRIRPLTLFATHYHVLTTEFADNALVQLRHMSFVVDPDRCDVCQREPVCAEGRA